jgi:putative endonuclease
MTYFVYAIYSRKFDKIYIGQTDDLALRFARHNEGRVFSTQPYAPWEIVYYEELASRPEAIKRERELKSHRGRDFIRGELSAGRVRRLPD